MRRLLDDPQTAVELRQTLAEARAAGHDYDALSKLAQVRAAIADPSNQPWQGQDTALAGASKTGFGWHTLTSMNTLLKSTLVAAILGGSMYAAWHELRRPVVSTPATHSQPLAADTPTAERAVQPNIAAEPDLTATPATSTAPELAPPAAEPSESPAPTAARTSPNTQRIRADRPTSASRREIAQLVRIRALLEDDPVAAYKLARRSEREFPDGVLRQERRAMIVLALAKRGSTAEAQRAAEKYFQQYPQSPMRAVIEDAMHQHSGRELASPSPAAP